MMRPRVVRVGAVVEHPRPDVWRALCTYVGRPPPHLQSAILDAHAEDIRLALRSWPRVSGGSVLGGGGAFFFGDLELDVSGKVVGVARPTIGRRWWGGSRGLPVRCN